MQDDEPSDDELLVEDLDDRAEAFSPHAARLLAAVRRLTWRSRRRAVRSAGVGGLALTLALALVLLASDNQPPPGAQFALGAAPVTIQPDGATAPITMASHIPSQLGSSGWERITLPNAPSRIVRSMAPSPTDPSTVFACTGAAADSPYADPLLGPIVLWRTRDAGAHWTTLPLPPLVGTWCAVQVAADDSARVMLATDEQPTSLYLSDDGGDHWMRLSAPSFELGGGSFLWNDVTTTAHHLFVAAEYRLDTMQLSRLARSDDDGRTWVQIGQALGSNVLVRPFIVGNENTLVTTAVPWGGPTSRSPSVWLTRDAGATWTRLTDSNSPWTANLVTLPVHGTRPPVYAMIEEQIPSYLFRLKARRLSDDGSTWSALPPLPVDGASPSRTGLLQIFEETSDGRLLAFGVDPQIGVPSESAMKGWTGASAQWLWVWDQRARSWLVAPTPLPLPYRWGCGVCLEHHATWAAGPAANGAMAAGTYLWLQDVLADGFGNGNVRATPRNRCTFVPQFQVGRALGPESPDKDGHGRTSVAYRIFIPNGQLPM